jgi:hypothetical protein
MQKENTAESRRPILSSAARAADLLARMNLESGQRTVISFTLGAAELGLWNRELRQVVEPGWFTVRVGASSADIRGEERFEVVEVK